MSGTNGGWPERWPVNRTARPEAGMCGWRDTVRVLPPRAPHAGEVGTVRKVVMEAGELVVRVNFADGSGDYFVDELRRVKAD